MYLFSPGSSSDSDEMSLSDNDDDIAGPDIPACTPLAAFLSFKQEAEKRRASQVQLETPGKVVAYSRDHKLTSLPRGTSALGINRVLLCHTVARVSPDGGDVPLADFSGAVFPFPAAAAPGRPVPGPVKEAPHSASQADEGSACFLPPASQGQEQYHPQPGGGHQPATHPQSTERRWGSNGGKAAGEDEI